MTPFRVDTASYSATQCERYQSHASTRSYTANQSTSYQYTNYTGRELTVTTRQGLGVNIPPLEGYAGGPLVVSVAMYANEKTIRNTLENLKHRSESSLNDGYHWTATIEQALRVTPDAYGLRHVTVDYVVSTQLLNKYCGRVYVIEVDSLVEFADLGLPKVPHPCNKDVYEKTALNLDLRYTSKRSFFNHIRIIDNTGNSITAPRYINIAGAVYKIPVEYDPSCQSGVHVYSRKSLEDGGLDDPEGITCKYYTLEEADKKFNLFLTAEEAMYGGSVTETHRDVLAHKTAEMKLEELNRAAELQRVKHETDKEKSRIEGKKETQKIIMEWIKVIGSVLSTVLTIYLMFKRGR